MPWNRCSAQREGMPPQLRFLCTAGISFSPLPAFNFEHLLRGKLDGSLRLEADAAV